VQDSTKALEIEPKDAAAFNIRGYAKMDLAEYVESMADHQRAVELQPKQAENWFGVGAVKERTQDYAGAAAAYTRAQELEPKDGNYWRARGVVRGMAEDYTGARADYEKVLELNPSDPAGFSGRGHIKALTGDFIGGVEDQTTALGLDPKLALAWQRRGYANMMSGNDQQAVKDSTKALELAPVESMTLYNRANASYKLGDSVSAAADYLAVAKLEPADVQAWVWLGNMVVLDGKNKEAVEYYTKAISMDASKTAELLASRGVALCCLGRYAEALADFRNPLLHDSSKLYAPALIWVIQQKSGQPSEAGRGIRSHLDTLKKSGKPLDWVGQIGRFLAGEMPEAEFLAAAAKAEKEKPGNGEMCEANFYAGMKRLESSDKAGAKQLFTSCAAAKLPNWMESRMARVELEALK
jgi:tetratricopeptide (TPR) repeat protein